MPTQIFKPFIFYCYYWRVTNILTDYFSNWVFLPIRYGMGRSTAIVKNVTDTLAMSLPISKYLRTSVILWTECTTRTKQEKYTVIAFHFRLKQALSCELSTVLLFFTFLFILILIIIFWLLFGTFDFYLTFPLFFLFVIFEIFINILSFRNALIKNFTRDYGVSNVTIHNLLADLDYAEENTKKMYMRDHRKQMTFTDGFILTVSLFCTIGKF